MNRPRIYCKMPESLAVSWEAGENLSAGDPCYISSYNSGVPVLSKASGTSSTGPWQRTLWFAGEDIDLGEIGSFFPWMELVLNTTGRSVGDTVFLGDPFSTYSFEPTESGYAQAARVVGEVLTVGASGIVRVFGDFIGNSYLFSGSTGQHTGPLYFTGPVSGGSVTLPWRGRLLDAWGVAIGTDTGDWSVEVGGNQVFSETALSVNSGDIIRPTSWDWNNAAGALGDAVSSIGASGLTGIRVTFVMVPVGS